MPCRVVVLISGNGSNLQAMLDDPCDVYDVVAVFSNRPGVFGLERAATAGVDHHCIDHKNFADRASFDAAMQNAIDEYQPDLVVLAGFMRILTPDFVRHFLGRLINIHPSLLPKYPGLNTHQRAIDAGDCRGGATVHFVTEELDGGPAIVQLEVPILPGDTSESLAERVYLQEHRMYPLAVRLFAEGRLTLHGNRAHFDGQALPLCGVDTANLSF